MTNENHAITNARGWLATIRDLAERLRSDDDEMREEAREEAQDSALSVQVRGGWYAPGTPANDVEPEEFEILLTTGGPALRIFGDIGSTGALQWQDWFKPWTDLDLTDDEERDLAEFVSCFYLGD